MCVKRNGRLGKSFLGRIARPANTNTAVTSAKSLAPFKNHIAPVSFPVDLWFLLSILFSHPT